VLAAGLPPQGEPSHAYLFHGPSGTGKRSLARAFAETVVNYTSNKADAGGWDASAGGFPAMTGDVPFLMKDVVLLAVSFYLLKQDVQSVVLSKVSRP